MNTPSLSYILPVLISHLSITIIFLGNQQLLQGNQQIIAVSNNQPIIMNAPMKSNVHRVVQQPQRSPVVTSVQSNQVSVVVSEAKTSVIQSCPVSVLLSSYIVSN